MDGKIYMTTRLFVGTVLTGLGLIAAGGATHAADVRVEKALTEAGIAYEIDEEGDFVVGFGLEGERLQSVFVVSETDTVEMLEIRQVWSMAFLSKRPLSADLANRLLRENGELVVGRWQIVLDGSDHLVLFAAQIPADSGGSSLAHVLEVVANVADDLEEELTKADEF
jgi:hypothetical protein